MNKVISKKIFTKHKILTPKYYLINKDNLRNKLLRKFLIKKKIKLPVVLKPVDEGSSLGVKIVNKFKDLSKSAQLLLRKYNEILLEEYIGGQEIQAAVLNNKSLGAIELIPKDLFTIIRLNIIVQQKLSISCQQE